MTDTAKNYSKEDEVYMVAQYQAADSQTERDAAVAAIAEKLEKSEASVRAKLAHLKVYVPKNDVPKGKNVVRKSQLVAAIAQKLEMDEDSAGSLEKATKAVLMKVLSKLNQE